MLKELMRPASWKIRIAASNMSSDSSEKSSKSRRLSRNCPALGTVRRWQQNSYKHQLSIFYFEKKYLQQYLRTMGAVSVFVFFHKQLNTQIHTRTHTQAISRVTPAIINIQGVPKTHHHEYCTTKCTFLTVGSP